MKTRSSLVSNSSSTSFIIVQSDIDKEPSIMVKVPLKKLKWYVEDLYVFTTPEEIDNYFINTFYCSKVIFEREKEHNDTYKALIESLKTYPVVYFYEAPAHENLIGGCLRNEHLNGNLPEVINGKILASWGD